MQFPWTMFVLESGSLNLVTAANLWPRYDHIEMLRSRALTARELLC